MTQALVTSTSETRDKDLVIPVHDANPTTTSSEGSSGPIVFEHWHVVVGSVLVSVPTPAVATPTIQPGATLDVILPFHDGNNTSDLAAIHTPQIIGLLFVPQLYNPLPVRWQVRFTATSDASGAIRFGCEGGKRFSAVMADFAAAKHAANGLPLLVKTVTSARRAENGGAVDPDLRLLSRFDNADVP